MKIAKSAMKSIGPRYTMVVAALIVASALLALPVLSVAANTPVGSADPKILSVSYSIVLAPGQGDSFWVPCPIGAACSPDSYISADVSVTVAANGTGGLLQFQYGKVNPITSGPTSNYNIPTFASGQALSVNAAAYLTTISNHDTTGRDLLFQITWVGTFDPSGQ
jgi:hypothetical protein